MGKSSLKYRRIASFQSVTVCRSYGQITFLKTRVEKRHCVIGKFGITKHRKLEYKKTICDRAVKQCNNDLAKMLYNDCEDIRKKRGLPKPQDIKTTLTLDDMNLDLKEDEDHIFEPKPVSDKPIMNHYYALSCPVVFRFPYFTIALLFKEWDPSIVYDETTGLKAVAHMLPKYLREGINNERIQNFDALALDANLINWCNIPRNYICITEEKDPDSKTLCNCNLCFLQETCADPSHVSSAGDEEECEFTEMIENIELTNEGRICPDL
ncbi:unnamed protein product [Orchesella dallaii]|uniref:Uncharacterized protein n=1 Tax=Orchesella dallaii TaxID=48710 RepID=A0ABP1Q311_9HEXA